MPKIMTGYDAMPYPGHFFEITILFNDYTFQLSDSNVSKYICCSKLQKLQLK